MELFVKSSFTSRRRNRVGGGGRERKRNEREIKLPKPNALRSHHLHELALNTLEPAHKHLPKPREFEQQSDGGKGTRSERRRSAAAVAAARKN